MTILGQILAAKRDEVAARRRERSLEVIERELALATAVRSLRAALVRPPGAPVRVLAEIKRASPSAGPIRADADPAAVAIEYAASGAAAISVLTDERFFAGRLEFLGAVRAAVALPLLRKDFIIDPYQVAESRAAGADALLLIVTALDPVLLAELLAESRRRGLEVLVEVHDAAEAERAVRLGADLIGVNHRDLASFAIDMGLTGAIAPHLPPGTVLVAESGIQSARDVAELGAAGAHAVLVGERLMRAPSPGEALRELLGAR